MPDLSGWFSTTIYRAASTGFSGTGLATFGAPVAVQARVEPKLQWIRAGQDGTMVLSTHQLGLPPGFAVSIEDRFWLPGESSADATIAHVPMRVDYATDKAGTPVYAQVYL